MTVSPYPQCKASGVDWLGAVPAHWDVCALNYRFEIDLGKMLDEKRITGDHLGPYLRNTDVQWGRVNIEDLPVMDFSGADLTRYALLKGDLLVCEGGEIGRAAVWEGQLSPCFYQKALHRLRPRRPERDCPRFTLYLFSTAAKLGVFAGGEGRSTIAHLPAETLRRYRMCFPSPHEQIAIATFLDRETGKIDALVEEQRRLIALLKEKRQAVISHAVTKGLNPNTPMKDSGIEWLGEVPAHWTVAPLKYIARVQTGVAKGKDMQGRDSALVPYLRVANVQDGYLDLSDVAEIEMPLADIERYLLQVGDVLMNEGGDFDKLGRGDIWQGQVAPCIHQNHVFAVRPTGVSPKWLNTFTGSSFAQFYFMGRSKQSTNLASISSRNVMDLPVVVPPSGEQLALAQAVKSEVERLMSLIDQAETAIALLAERRAALISAAVTGKIDVRGLVAAPTAKAAA
ncbi:restriction endonuclease subunit S [Sphingomonas sp. HMP6]|uniref:restriction endonuclease subunit S n=1 Tax=Sphingomonas sp. HMP6 TaxID=1517551 RepID=UPI0018D70A6F|nr:restriction endonuclease subunit S [Sphingomonas sp. HMP6]